MAGSYEIASLRIKVDRATIAALCANLVGIGLARFGYTPLIPALIAANWFLPSQSVYLGAANLAGYLAGALGARLLAARIGSAVALRAAMMLAATSLFACAFRFGFAWYFLWRFGSGATGGVLMALAAPTAIAAIPPARRGIAGGVIFTGVGLGIAASGTLVPLLVRSGLVETWLGLAAVAGALTALTWTGWPASLPGPLPLARPVHRPPRMLQALYLEYALNAVGLVPHMVFLVDFVARGLGRGLQSGGLHWIIFGAGAVVGPLLAGHVGDRIGFRSALRLAFLIQMLAVVVPLVTISGPLIALSSFVVGAFVPGIVAITIGRTRELVPHDPSGQAAAWSYCTTAFAVGQAIAGYGFSYVFARTQGNYAILFGLAAIALLLALMIDFAAAFSVARNR
jgi:predicted MFS family arabinose efflux permease